jgi:hypothetical protein
MSIHITHISDTHALHRELASDLSGGDLLIHTGDISNIGEREEVEDFIEWFGSQPYQFKVFIAGNHDLCFKSERLLMVKKDWHRNNIPYHKSVYTELPDVRPLWVDPMLATLPPGVIYLQDTGTELQGIKIWGSPASPAFGRMWAFNHDTLSIWGVWDKIPLETDILMTHTPPFGYGDMTLNGKRAGCEQLTHKILELGPVLHLCGHIHEGHGCRVMGREQETVTVNSALLGHEGTQIWHNLQLVEDNNGRRISLSSTH